MRKALRRAATIVVASCVVAGGAYAVKTLLLDDDDDATSAVAAALDVRVLRPGTFASAHRYAPYYVVPRKRFADPSQISRLARNKLVSKPESALSKGALAGSPQIVRLSLRATSGEPVTVEAVRFRVLSDARPLRGWYTAVAGCRVTAVPRARLALDSRRGAVRYAGGESARRLALVVERGTPRVLELQASTARRRVAWTAQLSLRDESGATSTVTVDDGGAPFRVTSPRSSQAYRPIYGASGIIGYARQRGFERC